MRNIVILSGAGLSADSGIQTFRAKDGLWENHPVDEVATPEGFHADPRLVHRFYNERRRQLATVEPNAAHHALAELERSPAVKLLHVTQNVDNLCERAGSNGILHMHGELTKCRCLMGCGNFEWDGDTSVNTACPGCGFTSEWGGIRPHIVWFGEMPLEMDTIEIALKACDLFVAVGTSGKVYPAAGFVALAKRAGAKTLLLNKDQPDNRHGFDSAITGNASDVVPAWVESIAR